METNQIAYEKILNLLYEYNPWWRNIDFHVPEYRTKLFYDLCGELDSPSIEIVYGPRQVGKTVRIM
jgi:predicted AAA+ superfamily ATPase